MSRKSSRRASPQRALSQLGHVLAALRHRRGWSREELARASELSVKTVARYEASGRTPSLSTLDAVLTALDCQLGDVLMAEHASPVRLGQAAERRELQAQVVDLHRRLERVQKELLGEAAAQAGELARSLATRPIGELERQLWLTETRLLAEHLGELRQAMALEPPSSYAVDFADVADIGYRPGPAGQPVANDR